MWLGPPAIQSKMTLFRLPLAGSASRAWSKRGSVKPAKPAMLALSMPRRSTIAKPSRSRGRHDENGCRFGDRIGEPVRRPELVGRYHHTVHPNLQSKIRSVFPESDSLSQVEQRVRKRNAFRACQQSSSTVGRVKCAAKSDPPGLLWIGPR